MRNVVFSGIDLQVESGVPVFAECPECGPTTALAPAGQNIILEDVLLQCQKCGGPAEPLPGFYTFEMKVFPLLAASGLTRQQARRFVQKAEKAKSLDTLEASSATIHPSLAQAVQEAKKQDDPWGSIKKICRMALFVANIGWKGVGAFGTATGAFFGAHQAADWYQQYTAEQSEAGDETQSSTHGNLADGDPRPERKPDLKPSSGNDGN